MRFLNYKRINIFKQLLETFSDENRLMCFGVFKSFISGRYKWIASFLFKNRNNLQTNKHKCSISFYSDNEILLNEFGNVPEIQSYLPVDRTPRPKIAKFSHELSSRQYKTLGQEYTEFDKIDMVDASGQMVRDALVKHNNHIDIFHKFGDAPAFIATGYRLPMIDTYPGYPPYPTIPIYIYDTPPVSANLKYNNLEIVLNDDPRDLYNNPIFKEYVDGYATSEYGRGTNTIMAAGNIHNPPAIMEGEGVQI